MDDKVFSIAERSGCAVLSKHSALGSLLIRCRCGREFTRTRKVILRKKNGILQCPRCRYKDQSDFQIKRTDYRSIIVKHGGEVIGEIPVKSKDRVTIRCLSHSLEFSTRAYNVAAGYWGCPKCSNRYLPNLEEFRSALAERGAELLSCDIESSTIPLRVRCDSGHSFQISINKFNNGRWCPKCSVGRSVGERISQQFMEYVFGHRFEKKRPVWLTFEGKRLELDGYSEELKIAFEYDGDQHFRNNTRLSVRVPLDERVRLDKAKDSICKSYGVKLFRFKEHKNGRLLAEQFRSQHKESTAREPESFSPSLKEAYAGLSKTKMDSLFSELSARGWSYVSGEYEGINSMIEIACGRGHKTKRNFYSIVSRGIFYCKECQ